MDCYCDRCNGDPGCWETGDHNWFANGWCESCGAFSGAGLAYGRYMKAEREGRACEDHFHKTVAAKDACRKPLRHPLPEDEELA